MQHNIGSRGGGWCYLLLFVNVLYGVLHLFLTTTVVNATTTTTNQDVTFHNVVVNKPVAPDIPKVEAKEEVEEWRRFLPPSLQTRKTLHRLLFPVDSRGGDDDDGDKGEEDYCEVYLLGTSHISASSCDDVRLLMEQVLPDCLFMELCPQRVAILEDPPESLIAQPPPSQLPSLVVENNDDDVEQQQRGVGGGWFRRRRQISPQSPPPPLSIWEQVRSVQNETGMTRSSALSAVLLTKIQGDYADTLNVTVGAEFKEAYQTCLRRSPQQLQQLRPRVILGDRPVRLTLLRAWESLGWLARVKLVLALLWSSLKRPPSAEELKEWMESILNDNDGEEDVLSKSIKELSRHFPTMERVIIRERDAYMYAKLSQVAQLGARRVVAVVGAGHCPGICRLVNGNGTDSTSTRIRPEEILKDIVETKRHKLENDAELKTLVSDVIELNVYEHT